MDKCAKCDEEVKYPTIFVEGGTVYPFCKICASIVDSFPYTGIIKDFLKPEDEMSQVKKNIFWAHKRRAQGEKVW